MINIHLDGDGCWPDLADKMGTENLIEVRNIEIGVLERGMTSGRTSISIKINLPDGKIVLYQGSLREFILGVETIKTRYAE